MGLIFSQASSGTQVVIIGNNVEEESGCNNRSRHVYLPFLIWRHVCLMGDRHATNLPPQFRVPRDVMQVLVDFQNFPSQLKNIKM